MRMTSTAPHPIAHERLECPSTHLKHRRQPSSCAVDVSKHSAYVKPSMSPRSAKRIGSNGSHASNYTQTIASLLAILGVMGDQLTTRIGLTIPGLYESNSITSTLMEFGLWLPLDILILIMIIGTPIILKQFNLKNRFISLFYPLILGTCRLITTVCNLLLISTFTLAI